MLNDTVVFLPMVDRPLARKLIYMIELDRKCQALVTQLTSMPSAEAVFTKIRTEAPGKRIVIDTGSRIGRNLLSCISKTISFDKNGEQTPVYLSQAFEDLIESKERVIKVDKRPWLITFLDIVSDARPYPNQNLRPATQNDVLLADIVTKVPRARKLPGEMARSLYAHPLCMAIKFLTKMARQFQGTHTNFEAKILESDTLQFARLIAKMWQSPFFSKRPLEWPCFVEGAGGVVAYTKSGHDVCTYNKSARWAFNDVAVSLLSGHARTRKRVIERRPLLSDLILTTDRLAKQLRLEFYPVFEKGKYDTDYDRVFQIIDLAVWIWGISLFNQTGNMLYSAMTSPIAFQLRGDLIETFYEKRG